MLNALRRAGMTAPKFDDRISTFVVTFPNHALLSDDAVAWLAELQEDGLTDSQCMALAALRDGQELDNPTYRKATGLDSRVATAELQNLVARELVQQIGSRRWARYRLSNRLGGPRARRLAPADRRSEILEALGDGLASRAELADRTGLTDHTVRRWLSVLRKEGSVEAIGNGSRSRNTLYRKSG